MLSISPMHRCIVFFKGWMRFLTHVRITDQSAHTNIKIKLERCIRNLPTIYTMGKKKKDKWIKLKQISFEIFRRAVLNFSMVEVGCQRANLRRSGISEGSVGATLGNELWEGKGSLRKTQIPTCNKICAGGHSSTVSSMGAVPTPMKIIITVRHTFAFQL